MVIIKRINGSTLPEVIISLVIASFLIGLISWSLLSMDIRKHIELYNNIIKIQTQIELNTISLQTNTKNETFYKVEYIVIDSSNFKKTIRKQMLLKDLRNNVVYTFEIFSLRNE